MIPVNRDTSKEVCIMPTYAILTRLSPEALTRPGSVVELNRKVEARIRKECPRVKWLANYAVLGPYDYLDIFEAAGRRHGDESRADHTVVRPRHHGNLDGDAVGSVCQSGERAEALTAVKPR
jgi:uncharacterized protein with GYD domain